MRAEYPRYLSSSVHVSRAYGESFSGRAPASTIRPEALIAQLVGAWVIEIVARRSGGHYTHAGEFLWLRFVDQSADALITVGDLA
jgi:hypothetical protein